MHHTHCSAGCLLELHTRAHVLFGVECLTPCECIMFGSLVTAAQEVRPAGMKALPGMQVLQQVVRLL